MAHKIVFTKPDKVNGEPYKKGDTLSVSPSIYEKLKENGTIKDYSEEKSYLREED